MNKTISIKNIYTYIVILLLLTAIAIRGGASFKQKDFKEKEQTYSISDIQSIYPNASSFSKGNDGSLLIKDSEGNNISKILCSIDFNIHNIGYAGNTPVIIAFDSRQKISGVYLLKNQETEDFIKRITEKGLLKAWNGLALDTTLIARQVDAVSGATYSSRAIIKTVKDTASAFLKTQNEVSHIQWLSIIRIALTFLLLAFSLSMLLGKKFKKLYWYHLLIVFLIFGIWFKQMLSLGLLHSWLTKGVTLQNNIELITILLLSIAMSILGHRKYYCNYLCPMGAMQLLISKISPLKKRNLQLKISEITIRNFYLTFIWTTLLLGFSLPLFDMEPFTAFSFSVASTIMLCAGALILILSLFFNRPWCQFCPTGCLLDLIPAIKTNKTEHEK